MENKDNITAIILAGGRDFGRCPIASRLPTALWPLAGRTVLARLLDHLARHQIKRTVICSNGDSDLLRRETTQPADVQLRFLDESLPLGTAGSVRNAVGDGWSASLIVFHAAMVMPPDIDSLLKDHRSAKADLTVVLNPEFENTELEGQSAGIYICEPNVLEYIPRQGYCDIKETLIPVLVRAGKIVHAVRLSQFAGTFRDRQGYLRAVDAYLRQVSDRELGLPRSTRFDKQTVWISPQAQVDAGARIIGPVAIMPCARVAQDAVIFGPTIVGESAHIDTGSLVIGSILWDHATIGARQNPNFTGRQ